METIKNKMSQYMDSNNITWEQIQFYVYHPYFISILSFIVIIYLTSASNNLTPPMANFLKNPFFKIIFLVIVFLVYKINPLFSIIIVLVTFFIVLMLPKIYRFNQMNVYLQPDRIEINQLKQELNQHQSEHNRKFKEGLHPLNRPTRNTFDQDSKKLPHEYDAESRRMFADPNLDVTIYELNPPYAEKSLPENFKRNQDTSQPNTNSNISALNIPLGGPTRYSAYHGYKLTQVEDCDSN